MQTAVAFIAEFFGRLVSQRTVRPHPVVLAAKPGSFFFRFRHRRELLNLQKLVSEPAMERFDVAVFPRASRRDRAVQVPSGR